MTVTRHDDKRSLMHFGDGVFTGRPRDGRTAVLFTMQEPLALLPATERARFSRIELVSTMDLEVVEAVTASLEPGVEVCIGLGGGSALDMAKYAAWKLGVPAIMVPSILSVDACVTATAAVRERGRVRYVGDVVPEAIYVDYEILRRAPERLNRAGAADILSIHTALFDWELASRRTTERFDPEIAEQARRLVQRLDEHASDIRDVSRRGLRFLAEAFAIEDALCSGHGNSRPEEGSEHFLAYVIEYRTGRTFIHGELVGLCIIVMAALQGNDPGAASRALRALGIPHDLDHLGINAATLRSCVDALPEYSRAEGLPYSKADEIAVGSVDDIVDDVCLRYLMPLGSDDVTTD